MRNESLSSSLVGRRDRGLHFELKKTILNRLLGARRGIERELENARSQRPEPRILSAESRTYAQLADVGERIAQERIGALEALGQFLFNFDCGGQAIDWPRVQPLCRNLRVKVRDSRSYLLRRA